MDNPLAIFFATMLGIFLAIIAGIVSTCASILFLLLGIIAMPFHIIRAYFRGK